MACSIPATFVHALVSGAQLTHLSCRPGQEPTVTRSPEEALAMIEDFRRQLVAGTAEFASLAARESHCSSASRGGDLGEFG